MFGRRSMLKRLGGGLGALAVGKIVGIDGGTGAGQAVSEKMPTLDTLTTTVAAPKPQAVNPEWATLTSSTWMPATNVYIYGTSTNSKSYKINNSYTTFSNTTFSNHILYEEI